MSSKEYNKNLIKAYIESKSIDYLGFTFKHNNKDSGYALHHDLKTKFNSYCKIELEFNDDTFSFILFKLY